MDSKQIAQTILNQIKTIDPRALMAYGAKQFVCFGNNNKDVVGGLQFTVNGLKHKGKVVIELTSRDEYRIRIGKIYKSEWREKKVVDGVFCEDLVNVLDQLIEYGEVA